MAYKNDLYATYPRGYFKQNQFSTYDCLLCNDIVRVSLSSSKEVREQLWNERLAFMIYVIKNYWAPLLVFIAMLILTMLHLRKLRFAL
jgi:hypothetical protein